MLIGLVSDTHIPYRAAEIPPEVFRALRSVDLILHAGDVDEPWALEPLQAIAPVYAVRGNYHILDRSSGGATLPETVELELEGFNVAMTHGHKLGPATWFWKAFILFQSMRGRWTWPSYDRATARALLRRFPDADIIVFGHTHRFYQRRWGKSLLINPGAALQTAYFDAPYTCSLALLHLVRDQSPRVERIQISATPG